MKSAVSTSTDALGALAASLFVPDGEVRHITTAGRRLLTSLKETLSKPVPGGVCSIVIAVDPIED